MKKSQNQKPKILQRNNWQTKKLGEICEVVGGGTPSTSIKKYWDNDYCWATPKDLGQLDGFEISKTERKISKVGLKDSSAKLLPTGSVILSSRAPIGYVFINTVEMATNQGCRSFVCGESVLNKYLYYFFVFNKEYLNKLGAGTTFKEVSGSVLREIEIPLPPPSEQRRIVKILDEAFEKLKKVKENTEKNLQNSEELFESYLNDIFSNPGKDWEEKQLGDIGKVSMCKRVFKEQTTKTGDIPFYKIGTFGKDPDAFISKEIYNQFRNKFSFPKKGDILISASGTIGRRVRYDGEPAYFQDSNIVWIDNNEKLVLNDYLYHFYGACNWNSTKGATISRLYNGNLRQIKISFPKSFQEQKQIVKKIDQLSEKTQKLESLYKQKLENIEELKKSILNKAFSKGL